MTYPVDLIIGVSGQRLTNTDGSSLLVHVEEP